MQFPARGTCSSLPSSGDGTGRNSIAPDDEFHRRLEIRFRRIFPIDRASGDFARAELSRFDQRNDFGEQRCGVAAANEKGG